MKKVWVILLTALAVCLTAAIACRILSVVGALDSDRAETDATGELKTYAVASRISELKIHINAADLTIKEGGRFFVESNLKNLTVEEKNGCLILKDLTTIKLNGSNAYKDAVLTVYVPAGTVFEKINLNTGAGRVTAGELMAETVDLELGAGDALIDTLVATKSADIEGGAGRIAISGGALHNLELGMGVGQLNLTSALTGECQLELGIGKSNITLVGNRADYALDIEKGIGEVRVDGKLVSDYGSSGNGTAEVKIQGGISAIYVEFKEQETV
jgi:DUF4097 and DUF4098 domain-containing protein YvlB